MSAFGHIQTFLEEHANRRLQPLRYLHDCSDCFRLERLPGGTCTHWKAPPLHGARQVQTLELYSITSSARERRSSETFRPRALAVFRLITSSNLVGCKTGSSAGFAPFRTLPV